MGGKGEEGGGVEGCLRYLCSKVCVNELDCFGFNGRGGSGDGAGLLMMLSLAGDRYNGCGRRGGSSRGLSVSFPFPRKSRATTGRVLCCIKLLIESSLVLLLPSRKSPAMGTAGRSFHRSSLPCGIIFRDTPVSSVGWTFRRKGKEFVFHANNSPATMKSDRMEKAIPRARPV